MYDDTKDVENKEIENYEELASDIQKNITDRANNIQNRLKTVSQANAEPEKKGKWWENLFNRPNKVTKGVTALATKAVIDVELLASQEEAAGELKLEGLGLLDRIQAGKKTNKELNEAEGKKLLKILTEMKKELTQRIDKIEDTVGLNVKTKENPVLPNKITNTKEAYNALENLYKNLTSRLDVIETKHQEKTANINKDKIKENTKVSHKTNSTLGYEGEEPKDFSVKRLEKVDSKKPQKKKKKNREMSL